MQREFWTAVMFLTRVPVGSRADHDADFLARSTLWWPLIGLGVGAVSAALFAGALALGLPPLFAGCAGVAGGAIVTGCFHEDAWADVCDGFGGYTPAKRLEIMRDSRVGAFGVVGLGLYLLGMASLLAGFAPVAGGAGAVRSAIMAGAAALIAGHVLGRWSSVLLIWSSPYVSDGASLAKPLAARVGAGQLAGSTLLAAILLSLVALTWSTLSPSVSMAGALGIWGAAALGVMLWCWGAARFFRGFIGGLSGDALGAANLGAQVLVVALVLTLSGGARSEVARSEVAGSGGAGNETIWVGGAR